MGIQGLLPFLKGSTTEKHISAFRGKRVAVDGYAWLHKGTYACCEDLAKGIDNPAYIKYCLGFIDMLRSFDIEVTLVFDGHDLPAKKVTEVERRAKRAAALQQANECARNGDRKMAWMHYTRCSEVTPLMAAKLIKVDKAKYPRGLKVVVAPYEADPQLAYLSRNNLVDLIISEDSDTVPFHCKEVLFKLEPNGSCQHLVVADIFQLPELASFTPEMVTVMCIIAGCDYLPSVKGIALKKSHKLMDTHKTMGAVLRAMRLNNQLPLAFANTEVSAAYPPTLLMYELEFFKVRFKLA
jgi:exonuclease-1